MPATLTSRERLLRVLRGEPLDRVPVRLWGVDPLATPRRAAWQPLHDLVNQYALDSFFDWGGAFPPSTVETTQETRETADPEWYEMHVTVKAPAGDLTRVHLVSRRGKPGYTMKHLIATVEDARRWLSLPDPGLPDPSSFPARVAQVGDRGLVMTYLAEPMYAVNDLTGSELWGYWLYDERELIHEMVSKVARQWLAVTKHYLAHGVGPFFGWYGPELCIPPLASPADFDDLVGRYDQPIMDLVHDAGGYFWIHCHGDMHPVLERFADMGTDCLNPIEPPPMGKLTLAEAKQRVGDRMTLEGGFEVGDLELDTPELVAAKVEAVMAMGKPGGRFIMCPSSDHTHWPEMDASIVKNYRTFVETALRVAQY